MYIIEPTEENTRIAGEKITVFDYPDGSIAFRHLHRPLGYRIFDKLACIDQGAVVDNKRLGAVLRLAQQKQDELEAEGKRLRSKKMPRPPTDTADGCWSAIVNMGRFHFLWFLKHSTAHILLYPLYSQPITKRLRNKNAIK